MKRHTTRRKTQLTLTVVAAGIAVLLAASPAWAQTKGEADPEVVLRGTLRVPDGTVVSDAVIFDGDAIVDGTVTGTVVAFHGDVTVSGVVDGDVVAFSGRVVLTSGATVDGRVVSVDRPDIADGATIGGGISRTPRGFGHLRGLGFGLSRVAFWIGASLSALVLGLLMLALVGRQAQSAAAAVDSIGPAFGWGALVFFGLPIGALIVAATIVGLPLALGVLLALGLLYWIGWAVAALAVGRRLVRPPQHAALAFLAGWGILRVLALIPGIGGLVWFAAATLGLGGIVLAARRTTQPQPGAPATSVPVPPPPPPPPH